MKFWSSLTACSSNSSFIMRHWCSLPLLFPCPPEPIAEPLCRSIQIRVHASAHFVYRIYSGFFLAHAVSLPLDLVESMCGEFYNKPRTLALPFGFGPYLATVALDYLLRNVEAVAGRVNIDSNRIFAMPALSEKPPHVFRSDADAVIFDAKPKLSSRTGKFDVHLTSRRSVFYGIVDKISNRMLFYLVLVSRDRKVAII